MFFLLSLVSYEVCLHFTSGGKRPNPVSLPIFIFIRNRIICLLKDKKVETGPSIGNLVLGSTEFVRQDNIIRCCFLSFVSECKRKESR